LNTTSFFTSSFKGAASELAKPRKLLTSLAFLGTGYSLSAFTFSSSTLIPFELVTKPKNTTNSWQKEHF